MQARYAPPTQDPGVLHARPRETPEQLPQSFDHPPGQRANDFFPPLSSTGSIGKEAEMKGYVAKDACTGWGDVSLANVIGPSGRDGEHAVDL